jgi:hypothetical protein
MTTADNDPTTTTPTGMQDDDVDRHALFDIEENLNELAAAEKLLGHLCVSELAPTSPRRRRRPAAARPRGVPPIERGCPGCISWGKAEYHGAVMRIIFEIPDY